MNKDAEAEIERLVARAFAPLMTSQDGEYKAREHLAWEAPPSLTGDEFATYIEASVRAAMAWAYQDAIKACNGVEWPPAAVRACIEAIEARAKA